VTLLVYLGRRDFVTLGTGAVVLTADAGRIDAAFRAARAQIDLIDRSCSRFRIDSDLERVNNAAGRAVEVGSAFLHALEVALDAARWTDGDVDPTIGQSLRALGYVSDFADIVDGPAMTAFAPVAGWRSVVVDRQRGTVRIPVGVRLDLGATAKAFAADLAAEAGAAAARCGVLVSLGGDIACAGEPPQVGWLVRVTEWHADPVEGNGQTILLHGGCLATSSTTVRRWRRGDDDVHHVIDPASGRPASGPWRTVTVAAASCVQANIATTAAIVRGERGRSWLESLNVPARLVRQDGHVVHLGDWPREVPT